MKLIAKEIKNGLRELVEVMEMEYSLDEVVNARNSGEPSYTVLSNYAAQGGTRYELAQFLRDARFYNLSSK